MVSLLVGLGVTLGVLIFSAGTTAPATVPLAVGEAAGGAVSIGLLTDAEAAAAAAALSLIWASLSAALLSGLLATGATELLGNLVLHPPTITFPNTLSNVPPSKGPQGFTVLEAHTASDLPTDITTAIPGGRIYIPPKKGRGKPFPSPNVKGAWEDAKGNDWVWAQDPHGGPHWDVQHPDHSHTNVAPNGKVIGPDNFPNNDSLVPKNQGGSKSGGNSGGKP